MAATLVEQLRTADSDKPKRQIVTVGVADIFAELPEFKWLCQELALGPGRPCRTIGKGFTGKSLMWQSANLSLAAGLPIWGRFACKQSRVAHFDYDQGYHATRSRYQRLALALGISPTDLGDRLRLVPKRDLGVYFSDPDAYDILCRDLEGFDLALVDAQRGSMPDVDENDSRVRRHLDMAGRVEESIGITFEFLHHGGKTKPEGVIDIRDEGRGSSAQFDAVGTELVAHTEGKLIRVQCAKRLEMARGRAIEPQKWVVGDEG